jgi:splicing factor 3A subunit 3
MSTALEAARRAHEDIERLLHLCADALSYSGSAGAVTANTGAPAFAASRLEACGVDLPRTSRDAEHLACGLVDLIRERCRAISQMHAPRGPVEAEQAAAMDDERVDPLSSFYTKLRELKAAHHRTEIDLEGTTDGAAMDSALIGLVSAPLGFSGEEGNGRYLDLHDHFAAYVNLFHAHRVRKRRADSDAHVSNPNSQDEGRNARLTESNQNKVSKGGDRRQRPDPAADTVVREATADYLAYIKHEMTNFGAVRPSVRSSPAYRHYLKGLLAYFISFADRSHPLSGVREDISDAETSLRADLQARLTEIRNRFASAEVALEVMGADGIRDELLMLGLKCGGTALERAKRLLNASSSGALAPDSPTRSNNGVEGAVIGERVVIEGLIGHIMEKVLTEERRSTALNIEKKQSLSWFELEAERLAEEALAERGTFVANGRDQEGEEETEQPVYNPKDVPLGWDGKPMPYWLFKLHGLNHEFKCEVCGNATYKVPRAFERHFTDPQHVSGLRCLGVSYSKHYYMVTRISDVQRLRDKIIRETKSVKFDQDVEMEYEDNEGNVMNRKTLTDLQRQGLL